MTLPAVITNSRKKEAGARLKKFYSTISQAVMLSEIDNGECKNWDLMQIGNYDDPENKSYESSEAFIKKYLQPYLKITTSGSKEKEWITSQNQKLKGYSLTFADGSELNVKVGACVDLNFDVNGERKPNQRGYDQFIFLICPTSKPCFSSYDNSRDRSYLLQKCKENNYFCSALLQYDNWEFKEDYPYKL